VVDGHELIVFDVPMSAIPVRITGDGYPLRMGDSTVYPGVDKIQALKVSGLLQSAESQPSDCGLDGLDPVLLGRATQGAGLVSDGDDLHTAYLIRRKLADWRGPQTTAAHGNSNLVLRKAAEWLFV